ncbi:MAG: DUF2194 domain-containing protein, partial [Bythopirellula sp.]
LMTESLPLINEGATTDLKDFVSRGGGLVVLPPRSKQLLTSLLVSTESLSESGEGDLPRKVRRCLFADDLIPGTEGLVVTRRGGYDIDFRGNQGTSSSDPDTEPQPTLAIHQHGKGRVLVWNTLAPTKREARGLVVQSVMAVQPVAVQPIANVAVIQIDDFPAGFTEQMQEPIATEYGINNITFWREMWLPDMLALSREFEIPYTYFIPFNYNQRVDPPYEFEGWERAVVDVDGQQQFFSRYCLEQIKSGGELALHGYNHVPLATEHWGSKSNMLAALGQAARRWKADDFGRPPVSYVPPMNEFDSIGAQAVAEAFPSVKVICSSFSSPYEKGGNRDFGPEPWNTKLFSLPRVTSGHKISNMMRMSMTSAVNTMGVWTHFLHPDDIFDNPINRPEGRYFRNPKVLSWRIDSINRQQGLYDQFREWIEFANHNYPWLRYMRTDEAYQIVEQHLQNQVRVTFESDRVVLRSLKPTYLHVRINDGRTIDMGQAEGARLLHVAKGTNYTQFTIEMTGRELELSLEREAEAGQ